MPREILTIQVGRCGNRIGSKFWSQICGEHNVNEEGRFKPSDFSDLKGKCLMKAEKQHREMMDRMGVYFQETGDHRYSARSVCVDMDPETMDLIKEDHFSEIFHRDAMICGTTGLGNNFAKGIYTEGTEMIDEIMDVIRKQLEQCDCAQGFHVCHSLGGGTGSGLGCLILIKLGDYFPDRIHASVSVYPSIQMSDIVVEPYNVGLSTLFLTEYCDQTFTIDNESLFRINDKVLKSVKMDDPTCYLEMNHVCSLVMSGFTSSLRFPGELLNNDLRKLGVNLVPFPRLHFLIPSHAPLFGSSQKRSDLSINEITQEMWNGRNYLVNVKPKDGKFMAASCVFRGGKELSIEEVNRQCQRVRNEQSNEFIEWIPNHVHTSMVRMRKCQDHESISTIVDGTLTANTTAIRTLMQRVQIQFSYLLKRGAFLHWYRGEGLSKGEMEEAQCNLRDLILEYQDKEHWHVDLDDLSEDEVSESESEEESP